MKVPETPASVSDLDLMKRLDAYAHGTASWQKEKLGPNAKKACAALHTHLVQIVEKVLAPMMNRATARELDTFTMHDEWHGRKVAHLMWHILTPERQLTLTPPEIGLLVSAAHLHDTGMALSREDREKRLAPESDLWERVEASPTIKQNLKRLRDMLAEGKLADSKRIRLEGELFQAEEALLALDTRERHALRERYEGLIAELRAFHQKDPTKVPDVEECFSFDGDSFKNKVVDICVSHNEDADALVERDPEHFDRPRFPRSLPVGLANADLHMCAGALRLADILDFDRERTPPTLFHYLVPSSLSHSVSISELEWSKHLSISNWKIDQSAVVFRGQCKNHVVHHAVVQFSKAIGEEIASTRATFAVGRVEAWPFILPETVKVDIHEDGYHYVPYQFELDDSRVYELLMGRAIYDNPLVAVRELIQNAVDACRYRDALSKVAEPNVQADTQKRITIRYEAPSGDQEYPVLRVIDTGTGMDAWLIERWFLKVGRSYYGSSEFARERAQLRRSGVDFAPVSEFGIGFLSCFLLADRVDVETAMWEPMRGDTRKRHLEIDGPTRLIRIRESKNEGLKRLRGTCVSLTLVRGTTASTGTVAPPPWKEIRDYIEAVCQDLPYRLNLEYASAEETTLEQVDRRPIAVVFPSLYRDRALRIPVADANSGLEGEIAIVPRVAVREVESARLKASPVAVTDAADDNTQTWQRWGVENANDCNVLLRGGFNVGRVPGIPSGDTAMVGARVRMSWRKSGNQRYSTTNLARSAIADQRVIRERISETWIRHLIDNRAELPDGFMNGLYRELSVRSNHLRSEAWLEEYSALALYELGRNGWRHRLLNAEKGLDPINEWERGNGAAFFSGVNLYGELLDLVLPRIAPERGINSLGDVYLMPPLPDWRETLRTWNKFISEPIRWSRFVSYEAKTPKRLHLHWTSGGLFNKQYSGRLKAFNDQELGRSANLFRRLLNDRSESRQTVLSAEDASLLNRLIDSVGDLEISYLNQVAKLDSFRPK